MGGVTKKERTNAVICEEDGKITKLLPICPHCGNVNRHGPESINIWTVGSVELRECFKCRKRFKTLTLTVPPGMKPEDFYKKLSRKVNVIDITESL